MEMTWEIWRLFFFSSFIIDGFRYERAPKI